MQKTKKNSTVKLGIDSKKSHKITVPKGGQIADILKVVGGIVGGAAGVLGLLYLDRKGYLPTPSEKEEESNE